MKKWLLNNKLIILGSLLGGVAGFIYHKQVGCTNGGCMISGNPYISVIYFGVLGALLMNIIKPAPKKTNETNS